jgi:uncharacterized protein
MHLRARLTSARTPRTLCATSRLYSSDAAPPTPPLLQKLKGDLKTAMRAKDAARLSVLRSVLAATLNASKTDAPITTDAKLVDLLRRTARVSQGALEEFKAAGRDDLVEKEQGQITILEEYVASSGLEDVGTDELTTIVEGVVTALTAEGTTTKVLQGPLMKTLMAPDGPLAGKTFDKAELNKIAKRVCESN